MEAAAGGPARRRERVGGLDSGEERPAGPAGCSSSSSPMTNGELASPVAAAAAGGAGSADAAALPAEVEAGGAAFIWTSPSASASSSSSSSSMIARRRLVLRAPTGCDCFVVVGCCFSSCWSSLAGGAGAASSSGVVGRSTRGIATRVDGRGALVSSGGLVVASSSVGSSRWCCCCCAPSLALAPISRPFRPETRRENEQARPERRSTGACRHATSNLAPWPAARSTGESNNLNSVVSGG